jgi:hypothetical protein
MKGDPGLLPMPRPHRETGPHADRPAFQFLDITDVTATRTVRFTPSANLTSGSSQKALQAIRLVRSAFRQGPKSTVTSDPGGIVIAWPGATETEILQLCTVAERRLARLQQEPLTAKMVEEILSITAVERRRWSKDGRMPTSGRAFFSQGKKQVGLFVYSPETIRKLATRPDVIADWRRQDVGTPAFHNDSPPVR